MLTFNVNKQIMTRTDGDGVIADSIEYLTATFSFTDDWDGTIKTAIFNVGNRHYAVILENDSCVVPHEVIVAGEFSASVYGVLDDMRITSSVVTIKVGSSGFKNAQTPQPPTPSVYEHIMSILEHLQGGAVNKVLAKRSNADFDFKWVNNEGGGGGGSSVEWDQLIESGLKIATITIDDEPIDVYIPTPFSGDYDDLTNKPTIPIKTSQLINDSGYTTFDGDYNSLTNKPTIPDELADLTSDSTHRTVTDAEKTAWDGKSVVACTQELSTGTLIGTITINGTPVNLYAPSGGSSGDTVAWTQILSSGTKIGTITINGTPTDVYAPTPFSGNYNDLTNKPTIPNSLSDLSSDSTHRTVTDTEKSTWDNKSDFSGSYNDLTNKPTIPTKTSDLTNDSGFLTQHQSIKTLNGETLVGTGDVSTYQSETVTVSGGTASKQLTAHKLCVFDGVVLALTITLPQSVNVSDEFNFIFTTSANGCTLTVPNTVKWDGGTAPELEANTLYEVSIDGLGVALISQGVSTV